MIASIIIVTVLITSCVYAAIGLFVVYRVQTQSYNAGWGSGFNAGRIHERNVIAIKEDAARKMRLPPQENIST